MAFAAIFTAAALAVSCSKSYKDIEVKDFKIEDLHISSLRSVDAVVELEIDNPAIQKPTSRAALSSSLTRRKVWKLLNL